MTPIQALIEDAFERRADITPATVTPETKAAIDAVIADIDAGRLREAEKIAGEWVTHQWLKKAVLLSFRIRDNAVLDAGVSRYFDKVDTKFADWDAAFTKALGMEIDLSAGTLGVRSKRYSMLVENGVVKTLNIEESPGQATVSGAAAMIEQL